MKHVARHTGIKFGRNFKSRVGAINDSSPVSWSSLCVVPHPDKWLDKAVAPLSWKTTTMWERLDHQMRHFSHLYFNSQQNWIRIVYRPYFFFLFFSSNYIGLTWLSLPWFTFRTSPTHYVTTSPIFFRLHMPKMSFKSNALLY